MSCINTVTIGIDEWEKLKNRDSMLTKLETDTNAFVIFDGGPYYHYGMTSKNISYVGQDILRQMESDIKYLNERMKAEKDQWQEANKKLREENTELRRKKWWQLW